MRYLDLVLPEQTYEQIRAKLIETVPETAEAAMHHADRMIEKGRTEGLRDILLRQLALKFGALDDVAQARVRAGAPNELERWLERILIAPQLDAVFEP